MKHFVDVVLDQNGKPVASAAFGVYTDTLYTVLATVYSDAGITPITNPLTTDTNGRVNFYVADGRYYIKITKATYTTQQIPDLEISDVVAQPTILSITSSAPGNFTVAHGLAYKPYAASIMMTSPGSIWWQSPTMFDATNVYLVASGAGQTAQIWLT